MGTTPSSQIRRVWQGGGQTGHDRFSVTERGQTPPPGSHEREDSHPISSSKAMPSLTKNTFAAQESGSRAESRCVLPDQYKDNIKMMTVFSDKGKASDQD